MLLRGTLLLCVALALAAAVPAPSKKGGSGSGSAGLTTSSDIKQSGVTSGGGSVSSQSGAQGAAKSSSTLSGPGVQIREKAAVQSGVSASGAASGNSGFGQKAGSKSVVAFTKDGLIVRTGDKGKGFSVNKAGAIQEAGAKASGSKSIKITLPGGKKAPTIVDKAKGSAQSSSGHQASTAGDGTFKVINIGGTEIKLDGLSPDVDIKVKSKQGQVGRTTNGANIKAKGTTQGKADSKTGIKVPGKKLVDRSQGAANAGAAAQGASTDNGAFRQNAKSFSGAKTTKDGVSVRTGNAAQGISGGEAGVAQKTGANAGANKKRAVIVKLPDGKQVVRIADSGEASAQSSSGQQASSTGDGGFKATNLGGTDVRLGRGPGVAIAVESRQRQAGVTANGGEVSAQGKARGAGAERFKLRALNLKLAEKGAANAGTAAQAQGSGNSAYKQDASAKTVVKSIKDGLVVKTENAGSGKTGGPSRVAQTTGANGKGDLKKSAKAVLANGQKKATKVTQTEQGSASSSSGHQASSAGKGSFQTKNKAQTVVKSGDPQISSKKSG